MVIVIRIRFRPSCHARNVTTKSALSTTTTHTMTTTSAQGPRAAFLVAPMSTRPAVVTGAALAATIPTAPSALSAPGRRAMVGPLPEGTIRTLSTPTVEMRDLVDEAMGRAAAVGRTVRRLGLRGDLSATTPTRRRSYKLLLPPPSWRAQVRPGG